MKRTMVIAVVSCVVAIATIRALPAQSPPRPAGTTTGEWPSYHGDQGNQHYSPLSQINAANFTSLEVAWRFKTDNLGTRPEYKLEGTPLMVGGVVYTTAGTRRSVVALDAATGELRWVHGEPEGARGAAAPRQLSGRGVAYWTDGKDERILYVTPGFRLVALDAKTGARVAGFGTAGAVDLKAVAVYGTGQPIDLINGEIGLHATPAVGGDVVIVGSAFREGHTPKTHNNTKGLVQAFDVRTGKRLWNFDTIPRPGEFGSETWENDSWRSTAIPACGIRWRSMRVSISSTCRSRRLPPISMADIVPATISLPIPWSPSI
jgi:quinoprotein glucose dehydrogenase